MRMFGLPWVPDISLAAKFRMTATAALATSEFQIAAGQRLPSTASARWINPSIAVTSTSWVAGLEICTAS